MGLIGETTDQESNSLPFGLGLSATSVQWGDGWRERRERERTVRGRERGKRDRSVREKRLKCQEEREKCQREGCQPKLLSLVSCPSCLSFLLQCRDRTQGPTSARSALLLSHLHSQNVFVLRAGFSFSLYFRWEMKSCLKEH